MIVTKTVIPRRTVLRGVGTALALPLLDGMVPALTALTRTAAAPTKRLGVVAVPNGAPVEYWQPKAAGADFEWTPSLKALAPVREQVLVMTNLDSVGGRAGPGDHPFPGSVGVPHRRAPEAHGGRGPRAGHLDGPGGGQRRGRGPRDPAAFARAVARGRRHRVRGVDVRRRLQLRLPQQLVGEPHDADAPRDEPAHRLRAAVRDVGSTSAEARRRRIEQQRSILDAVKGKVGHLEAGLAPYDRRKLDEYLEAVRGIERRIQLAEQQADRELPDVSSPAGFRCRTRSTRRSCST